MTKQTISYRISTLFFCVILVLCSATAVSAQGINFSVDFGAVGLGSTAVNADNDPADVFIGGGSNNMQRLDKTQLGLGAADNVDAVAFAIPPWYRGGVPVYVEPDTPFPVGLHWYFSVDPAAVGAASTGVYLQQSLTPPEAAGDTFWTCWINVNSNSMIIDEGIIGLAAPQTPPEDDEDSLDLDAPFVGKPLPRGAVFFSLDTGSPSLSNPPGFTAGDILMSDGSGGFELAVPPYIWSDPGNAPWFTDGSAASLGIAGQDLDALFMDSANFPYFSIAGTYGAINPGDICVPDGLGTWPPSAPDTYADVVITYAQIGLLVTDNLNALDADTVLHEDAPNPEETWFVCMGSTKNYIPNVPDNVQPPWSGSPNWCSPTAALNVVEFWEVIQRHLNAAGLIDPLDLVFPGGRVRTLSTTNDWIGWFMDTNNLTGSTDDLRGNGNDAHTGTYNKDIDPGLDDFINWDGTTTGNEPGWFPATYAKIPAVWGISADVRVLGDPTSEPNAWTNMKAEIDAGRPVIMSFVHWNIQNPVNALMSGISGNIGASFYEWGPVAGSGSPGGSAGTENWNQLDVNPLLNVGHTVTVVGYIEQCDVDGAGSWPAADWVVCHDNWASTPTNVAVPWADFTNLAPNNPDTWWGNNGGVTEVSWWTGSVYSDPDLDSDFDGMPDWWENMYGLNPGSGADAGTDLDGDGMTNLQEYTNGTDPTDTDSDDDGFSDYKEDQDGTDPTDAADNTPFTPVWVDFGWTGIEMGTSGQPTSTIGDAIKQVSVAGTITIKGNTGTTSTSETPRITKQMRIDVDSPIAGGVRIGGP